MPDLPPPRMKDFREPLDRFVASLPFYRTSVTDYMNEVNNVCTNPQAPIDKLKQAFKTPVWEQSLRKANFEQLIVEATEV